VQLASENLVFFPPNFHKLSAMIGSHCKPGIKIWCCQVTAYNFNLTDLWLKYTVYSCKRQARYIWHNIVVHSCNNCCSGNTTMHLWKINATTTVKHMPVFKEKCLILHGNKRMFICSWPSLEYKAKKIKITDKSLHSFLIVVKCCHRTFYEIRQH